MGQHDTTPTNPTRPPCTCRTGQPANCPRHADAPTYQQVIARR